MGRAGGPIDINVDLDAQRIYQRRVAAAMTRKSAAFKAAVEEYQDEVRQALAELKAAGGDDHVGGSRARNGLSHKA